MNNEITIDFELIQSGSRQIIRKQVVDKFMEEKPGKGKGELTSKYRYNVEFLQDGKKIYLIRPAILNKGFDFVIHAENISFRHVSEKSKKIKYNDVPSMPNIFEDLQGKKSLDSNKFGNIVNLINRVYNCEDPNKIAYDVDKLNFNYGYSVELLLKVIKWFFIEQDIRYWNWSGRGKFWNKIQSL